jgi:hypothetical protein
MVLEVDLDNFIAQSEHDSVLRSHPFLDVNGTGWWAIRHIFNVLLLCNLEGCTLLSCTRLQVRFEVFQQSHFLLELLWIIGERVFLHHVLFLCLRDGFAFVVIEAVASALNHDLCGVIEEDTG